MVTKPKTVEVNTKKPLKTWVDFQGGGESNAHFYCRQCGEHMWIGKCNFLKFVRLAIFWESLHKHPDSKG